MDESTKIVHTEQIQDMIGNDTPSLNQFWEAAIVSFIKYRDEYITSMNERDLQRLRESGHRITPAAQMLGLDQIVTEYEQAKKLLRRDAPEQEIQASIARVQRICNQALKEFEERINHN